ncbi:MAG: NACHT domain-containing protein [Snowella sp.]|nr:NACHT domain-containing protein [Snowella sp.]
MDLPYLPDDFSWERVAKRYLKKVKAIIQDSDKLRPIFAAQIQDAIAEDVKNLAGIAPDYNLGKYAEGIRETYGNLRLESLNTTGVYYNEWKLWKIFVPQNVRECQEFLPQVYELPKEHIKRLQEAGEDVEILLEEELEQQRQRYINQQSRLIWEIIGNPTAEPSKSPIQHTVILGDPGSGKSSLLQYLALTWAQRPIRELSLYPLPLLIELRLYGRDKQEKKCQDLLSFIHGGNVTCRLNQQQLHEKLKSGSVIALFDGIDEIFDPNLRDEVVTDIHRFSNDYPQVQIITTSRWLGYKGERLRNAGFRHFMLQDLEIEQIEDFIERWHNLTFKDEADKLRKKERLIKAIQDSKSIRELAGNPLLLTMMAILNRNQELPRDRPELYNQASRVLLHQWDVERALIEDARLDPKTIDYRDKQAMLRKVAYFMQSSEKGLAGNVISAKDLENILTDHLKTMEIDQARTVARLLINQLRTRNFILCYLGADSYGFVHRTFLEYFCAWEFVWRFKETQELTIDELINDAFGKHWQDESWHEVLRLICGMIEPKFVAEIIDFLLEQKNDKSQFLDQSYRLKKEGLNNLILAANCLIEIRNRNAIISKTDNLLKILKYEVKQKSPPQLNYETVNILCSLIAIIGQDRSEILLWFKNCLELNSSLYVPELAVKAVAQGWKNDPDTLPWLEDLVLSNEKGFIRQTAIKMLARGWKNVPNILTLISRAALQDEHEFVRRIAVEVIAKELPKKTNILSLLKNIAEKDKDRYVRGAAMEAIAKGWKDELTVLDFLRNLALQDKNHYIRSKAIKLITEGFKEDSQLLEFLCDRALNDFFKRESNYLRNPRKIAVECLLENFGNNPKTLEILNQVALNDTDEQLRKFAQEKRDQLNLNHTK